MVLVAAAAIFLSIASGNPASEKPNAPPKVVSQAAAEQNPSPYQYREVPVGRFDRLRVSGPFKVGVLVGTEPPKVQVMGPPALLADTIATVEGGTLTIRFREGAGWSWNPGSGVNVFVSAPSLTAANVEGAAQVEVMGVGGDMFSAATNGSGSINASQVHVRHVQLATSGSGGITVEGSAREATYLVGGSGSIDAKRLRVDGATIAIGGAGSAYADVSGTADISVSGSGRVEVAGGATCIKRPVNSPRVQCR